MVLCGVAQDSYPVLLLCYGDHRIRILCHRREHRIRILCHRVTLLSMQVVVCAPAGGGGQGGGVVRLEEGGEDGADCAVGVGWGGRRQVWQCVTLVLAAHSLVVARWSGSVDTSCPPPA